MKNVSEYLVKKFNGAIKHTFLFVPILREQVQIWTHSLAMQLNRTIYLVVPHMLNSKRVA